MREPKNLSPEGPDKVGERKKYDVFFDTVNLKSNMKQRSVRGGFSMMGSELISFILRIGSTIILARLLMPEHFGLISMVTALTAFVERFKDLGLSTATVQQKVINHEQVSTLFWINVGFGLIIMLVVAACSGLISKFYGDRRLVGITLALSSGFLFAGLTIQHQALLRRQMRFAALANIKIFANVFSVVLGIYLAWKGYTYWALVCKEVARAALIAVSTWCACRWRPGIPVRRSGIGSLLRFGRDLTGFDAIYFLSKNIDQILIGKYWGAIALGFYRQANQLITMPISQIQSPLDYVAIPALCAVQSDVGKYRRYYTKIISVLCFIYMPIVVYIAIFSESIIRLLLGEKWLQSAMILRVIAVASFFQPVVNTAGTVMVTFGMTRRYFYWGVMNAAWFITAFSIGNKWGALGVASAYAIGSYLTILPSLWYSFQDTPLSIYLFFKAIFIPTIASIVMGFVLIVYFRNNFISLNIFDMTLSFIIAVITYFISWIMLPGGKKILHGYYNDGLSVFHSSESII